MASSTIEARSSSMPIPIVITTSLFALVTIMLLLRWRKRETGLPPGPRGVPLLGNLPFIGSELHHSLTELARVHGPVMSLRFGTKLCIVLSSPAVVREALRDKDAIFANHDPPAVALISSEGCRNMAWAPHGPIWRMMRKATVRDLLTPAGIESVYPLRRREVRRMVAEVRAKVGEGVRVGELMYVEAINVMMSMLWGTGVSEGMGKEYERTMEGMLELLGLPNVSDFFPVLAPLDIQGMGRRMRRLSGRLAEIFDTIVAQRQKVRGEPGRNRDFLDVMLEVLERGDPQTPFTMAHVRVLFLDLVVGGTDTTSMTTEWAMSELLSNPDILKKVQDELDRVVGRDRIVEESHISELRYLDAVIRETLRLHPATPFLIPYRPSSTTTVGGYTIPKDTRVLVNIWGIQRDPAVWDDPLTFKPERFLEAGAQTYDFYGNNFSFLPFGSGRRVCVGIALAEKMMMHTMASLLHSFDWSVPKGKTVSLQEVKFGIVLRKAEPLVAVPSVRLNNPELYD